MTLSVPFLIICLSIFVIAFLTRIYFLLKYQWVGKDTFYNLLVAQEIRKKRKLPDIINRYVVPEQYDYPPLFHWFLSLFKEKYHQKLQYLSPIFDMISGTIIFCFCYHLFDSRIAILATALYFFTPYTFDSSFSLSARSLGNCFLIISLLSLFLFLINGYVLAFAISVIFSTLVLLTHRLTTQSLVFVLLTISVGYLSIYPLFIIASSFVFALIVSKGFYYRVLKGHIRIIRTMGKKLLDNTRRKEIINLFPNPISLIFNMPIILLSPIFFLFYYRPPLNFFVVWGLGLIILSIVWIFGQGLRHLINAIPTFTIITSIWIIESQNYIVFFWLITISIIFFIYKLYRLEKYSNIGTITNKDILKGFDYIRFHKKNGNILFCLPLDLSYNAAYFTHCSMLSSSGGFAEGMDFNQHLHKLVYGGKINELIQNYNADWVIIIGEKKYSISGKNVFENETVTVIKIDEINKKNNKIIFSYKC